MEENNLNGLFFETPRILLTNKVTQIQPRSNTMAVQTPGNKTTAKEPKQQQQQQRQVFGTLPTFGLQSAVTSFGHGGETFEKLHEAFSKRIKDANAEVKGEGQYAVVKVLKQKAGLNYSGIVLTQTVGAVTSAHILMIEKTGDYPEKLIENVNGIRYEITRTPADALDDRYVLQAKKAVADQLGIDINSIVITDGTLVPNEFDVNSESQIEDLLRNTINAVMAENAIRVQDYKGINLADLTSDGNGKFFVNMFFNGDKTSYLDQSGMPVRQDICIGLTYKANHNGGNRSVNQGADTVEIVRTYGYIDFEWTGPAQGVGGFPTTQRYVPNFIITHMDSAVALTPDILALGVASVVTMNEDLNWMQSYRSVPTRKGEIDYNDIGALNIEGNIEGSATGFGKLYDTKSKSFSLVEMNTLVQTLVRPNMMVSIDVPKAGPDTWFTSVFKYIRFNGVKEAYERVNSALAYLTNGAFVHNNIPMFTDVTNKIHGGFYRTKDGFEDLRHLSSYLAVANYVNATNQAPAIISQYTNTLYNAAIPTELRAAERKKMLDEMSGGTAVYKQHYDRLTFTGMFLSNLVGSLRSVGFAPLPSSMGVMNDMFVRRSTADFGGALIAPDLRLMGQNNIYGNFQGLGMYNRTFG